MEPPNVHDTEVHASWYLTRAFTSCFAATRRHLSGEGIPGAIVGDRVLHVCLAACILEERITQIMLKRPPTPVRSARRTCLQLPSWSASYQVAFLKLCRACCTCARREVISPDDAVNATPATVHTETLSVLEITLVLSRRSSHEMFQ